MKITVVGTGYVGLITGACFADMGNDVICVDSNQERIEQLKNGTIPIYEPGLEELVQSNTMDGRLFFSTDIKEAVKKSQICFIAVGTPQYEDGSADIKYVKDAVESIAKAMNEYKIIVIKSTVPVGTAESIEQLVKQYTEVPFDIVSNPEFLRQGSAINDFLAPDRVIIGSTSEKASQVICELYAPFSRISNKIIMMDNKSAEMTKYAANSFLATKISFINEIANLCEKVGANAEMVRAGISADTRIGNKFLFPGIGYGGSCFPKDTKALIKTGIDNNIDMSIVKCAEEVNKKQREIFLSKITGRFGTKLDGITFAVWGLAFKPKTNDMREAPSITIIKALLDMGASINACDPKAIECAREVFGNSINYFTNAYDSLKNSDAMILVTEWNEFRRPDFDRMKKIMKLPIIFDGRNQYNVDKMKSKGFEYYCIGRTVGNKMVK